MTDNVKVKGTVEWANLNVVNEMSGKYQFDLCNLSDNATTVLSEIGVEARYREDKPEKGNYITLKSNKPIKAYDNNGQLIGADVLVGNGSKAVAIVGTYEWQFKNKKGISPSLIKLVITDLVEYVDEAEVETEDAV